MEIKGNISIIRKFVRKIIRDLEKRNEQLRFRVERYEKEIEDLEIKNQILTDELYQIKIEIKKEVK